MEATPTVVRLSTLRSHALALADLADRHDLTTPIATCGDWQLDDLVWHLAEVQDFWAWIIEHRPAGPEGYAPPARVESAGLTAFLRRTCERLDTELADADPRDEAWSWSDDHTVAFCVRRQYHEALVHSIDAVLAVGAPLPTVEPDDAADGVDELVTVMIGGVPGWATFAADERTLRLEASDAGRTWPLRFGRMTGNSPSTGTSHDLAAIELVDRLDRVDTTVRATALDLDLWLWGRLPVRRVEVIGDTEGVTLLRRMIVESTQ